MPADARLVLARLGSQPNYRFRWPDGVETYDECVRYSVSQGSTARGTIAIAFGRRAAYGNERRRILVFREGLRVLVELVGADDWESTGTVLWPARRLGSRHLVREKLERPASLAGFRLTPMRDRLTGRNVPFALAVQVREDDHESLVALALAREDDITEKKAPTRRSDPSAERPLGAGRRANGDVGRVLAALAACAPAYHRDHLLPSLRRLTGTTSNSQGEAVNRLRNVVPSFRFLLGYYAFARAGGEQAGYGEICADWLEPWIDSPPSRLWEAYPDDATFVGAFRRACREAGKGVNEVQNPRLLAGLYRKARSVGNTGLFADWAERIRGGASPSALNAELDAVHAIGPKIASFIVRDVIFLHNLEPAVARDEAWALQPIDVWVARVVAFLFPGERLGLDRPYETAERLAGACWEAGVSGVLVNQGAWYAGAQLAGDEAELARLLAAAAATGTFAE